MKKLLLLLIAALLINCRNNSDFRNVALESTITDSVYAVKKKDIDQLCSKILAIKEISTDLERPLLVKDSIDPDIDDDDLLKIASLKVDSIFLSAHKPFSNSNTIFVNRYTNLSLDGAIASDTIPTDRNHPFDIELFDPSAASLSRNPTIWNRYQSKNYTPDLTDSITKSGIQELKQSNNDYLQDILNAQYVVFVQDLYYSRPRLIDKKTFEGGILVTNVKIYDLSNGEKIGQATLFVTSSEKVDNKANMMDYSKFNKILLEENMVNQRKNYVSGFLKTGKISNIK